MPTKPLRACHRCGVAGCKDHLRPSNNWGNKRDKDKTDKLYGSKQWKQTRNFVMRRDEHICQVCKLLGRLTPAHAVDHIKPVSQLNLSHFFDVNNLQAICKACHAEKTQNESKQR